MNFSSILDISSFFIGMIINLLLVALVSYYFKRKYDHLEKSINEHSDHLYLLLKKERDTLRKQDTSNINDFSNIPSMLENMFYINPSNTSMKSFENVRKTYPSVSSNTDDSDSDSDNDSESSESDSDSDSDSEKSSVSINEIEELEENDKEQHEQNEAIVDVELLDSDNNNDTKQLTIQEIKIETPPTTFNIQKVDLPQDYNKLTMKQLKDLLSNKGVSVKPHMKKNELIDLATKNSIEIEFDNDTNKNSSHISIADCDLDLTNLNDDVTQLE
jgi:hypothetical protein